jgi:hypothetical protein
MNDLNEPTLLHNLRQRFMKDDIYTCVVRRRRRLRRARVATGVANVC